MLSKHWKEYLKYLPPAHAGGWGGEEFCRTLGRQSRGSSERRCHWPGSQQITPSRLHHPLNLPQIPRGPPALEAREEQPPSGVPAKLTQGLVTKWLQLRHLLAQHCRPGRPGQVC